MKCISALLFTMLIAAAPSASAAGVKKPLSFSELIAVVVWIMPPAQSEASKQVDGNFRMNVKLCRRLD